MFAHVTKQTDYVVVIQCVEGLPSLPAYAHQMGGPEEAQLVGHGRLGVLNGIGKVPHTSLALHQGLEQSHARRIPEESKRVGYGMEVTVCERRGHNL